MENLTTENKAEDYAEGDTEYSECDKRTAFGAYDQQDHSSLHAAGKIFDVL